MEVFPLDFSLHDVGRPRPRRRASRSYNNNLGPTEAALKAKNERAVEIQRLRVTRWLRSARARNGERPPAHIARHIGGL